jgi:hypothetical protein
MIVLCINCQNFNLQSAGRDWAVIGFGQCEITPKYAYKSARYSRECSSFDAAPDGVAEKRREWLESKMANAKVSGRPHYETEKE